ncbi:hypothetical protein MRB53_041697 [Persea americana]|nr:hypothetical protein MRB53_041697 [Persea americana]
MLVSSSSQSSSSMCLTTIHIVSDSRKQAGGEISRAKCVVASSVVDPRCLPRMQVSTDGTIAGTYGSMNMLGFSAKLGSRAMPTDSATSTIFSGFQTDMVRVKLSCCGVDGVCDRRWFVSAHNGDLALERVSCILCSVSLLGSSKRCIECWLKSEGRDHGLTAVAEILKTRLHEQRVGRAQRRVQKSSIEQLVAERGSCQSACKMMNQSHAGSNMNLIDVVSVVALHEILHD